MVPIFPCNSENILAWYIMLLKSDGHAATEYICDLIDLYNIVLYFKPLIDWVIRLGPPTEYDGVMRYSYSIVTDPFLSLLFVLVRDIHEFQDNYESEVGIEINSLKFTSVTLDVQTLGKAFHLCMCIICRCWGGCITMDSPHRTTVLLKPTTRTRVCTRGLKPVCKHSLLTSH